MTDERLAQALTRHLEAGGEIPDLGAPYDDLIAGLVSGTLLEDEREAALRALDEHPGLRALLARVAQEAPAAAPQVPAGRLLRLRPLMAVAALLVAGLGVAWFLNRGEPEPEGPDAVLLAAAESLRESKPALFADFAPLSEAERTTFTDDGRRGALVLLEPREAVLTGRPVFRWQPPEGVTSLELTVINEDGDKLLSVAAEGSTWLDTAGSIPPGRYVWKLVATTPARRLTSTLAFRRLDAEEEATYRAGLEAIETSADGETAALLKSHWSIRHGLLSEAHAHLESAGPGPVAGQTRTWLEKRSGR